MSRAKLIGIVIVIVVAAAIGTALLLADRDGSMLSSVTNNACAAPCLRFPTISGDNLEGQSFTLPADFVGKSVLVIVPFDENQQRQAQSWLPLARDLAAAHPDFASYNVPVFPSMAAPMRALIRAGMNLSIPDPQLRALTITVFLDDRAPFLAALNIPNTEEMQVFLLNADGDVIWRGSGEFTPDQGDALRAALAA